MASGEVGAATTSGPGTRARSSPFQTPSAGRWVLQQIGTVDAMKAMGACFKPHQRGGGCCNDRLLAPAEDEEDGREFQTPSAGRWVLQR